ncbi:hypothetical protein MUO79_11335 [Candidatus Bathyarchaeota archaeon]|nr:hypothetical protein [Candidatus Bathyarchaeota archaeon]
MKRKKGTSLKDLEDYLMTKSLGTLMFSWWITLGELLLEMFSHPILVRTNMFLRSWKKRFQS